MFLFCVCNCFSLLAVPSCLYINAFCHGPILLCVLCETLAHSRCWMDNEVIHYRLLVYSVIELLSLFSRKVARGHRCDTLAALPVGDTVLADDIFDNKLHKPRSCRCLCTLPAGCPCYLPAQAKNYAGTPINSPQYRNLLISPGWMAVLPR